MASVFGNMGPFDESSEQWCSYTERLEYFIAANDIDQEKAVTTFLSVMGPKTFTLLRNLLQPEKPGEKMFDQIVNTQSTFLSKALSNCRAISVPLTKSARRRNCDNVCGSAKKIS